MFTKIVINENWNGSAGYNGLSLEEISQEECRERRIVPVRLNSSSNNPLSFDFKEGCKHHAPTFRVEDRVSLYADVDTLSATGDTSRQETRVFYGSIKKATLEGSGNDEGVKYTCYGPKNFAKQIQVDSRSSTENPGSVIYPNVPIRIYNAPKDDTDYNRSMNAVNGDDLWPLRKIIADMFYAFQDELNALSACRGTILPLFWKDFMPAFMAEDAAGGGIIPTKITISERTFPEAILQILAESCPSLRLWVDPRADKMWWRIMNLIPPEGETSHTLPKRTIMYTREREAPIAALLTPSTDDIFTAIEIYSTKGGQTKKADVEMRNGVPKIKGSDPFALWYSDWFWDSRKDTWTCFSSGEHSIKRPVDYGSADASTGSITIGGAQLFDNEWLGAHIEVYRGEYDPLYVEDGSDEDNLKITGTVTFNDGYLVNFNVTWHATQYEIYTDDEIMMDKDPEDPGSTLRFFRAFQVYAKDAIEPPYQPATKFPIELSTDCCNEFLRGYYQVLPNSGTDFVWDPIPHAVLPTGEIITATHQYDGTSCLDAPVTPLQNARFRCCYKDTAIELKIRYPLSGYTGTASNQGDFILPDSLKPNSPILSTKKIFVDELGADPDNPAGPYDRFFFLAVYALTPIADIRFEGKITLGDWTYLGAGDTFGILQRIFLAIPEERQTDQEQTTGFEDGTFPRGLILMQTEWDFVAETVNLSLSTDARSFGGDKFGVFLKALRRDNKIRELRDAEEEVYDYLNCLVGKGHGYFPGGGGYGYGSGGSGGFMGGGGVGNGSGFMGQAQLNALDAKFQALIDNHAKAIMDLWEKILKDQKKLENQIINKRILRAEKVPEQQGGGGDGYTGPTGPDPGGSGGTEDNKGGNAYHGHNDGIRVEDH